MNTKYKGNPTVIANVRAMKNGDDLTYEDVVTGVQVLENADSAIAQINLRGIDLSKAKNAEDLIIEIELHELVAALSLATLHAEKDQS